MQSKSEFINYQRALAHQESRDTAAYYEAGLNGKAIDWRYWVHQMPALNAMQAACLMSALEPDIFANLNGRPGKTDPAKYIEKARKIQRLAEAQGRLTAPPAEWLEWAKSQSVNVHPGFLLAVEELPEATGESSDADGKGEAGAVTSPSGDVVVPMSTTNQVYWRVILNSNIKKIDGNKKASVREIIKYLRVLGDKRLPDKGAQDELLWIDDMGTEQRVQKKAVSNAASNARNPT